MSLLKLNNLPRLVKGLTDGNNIKIKEGNHIGSLNESIKSLDDKRKEVIINKELVLENNKTFYRTGCGNSLDMSDDLIEGISNIGLKGNSIKNLVINGISKKLIKNSTTTLAKYDYSEDLVDNTEYTVIFYYEEVLNTNKVSIIFSLNNENNGINNIVKKGYNKINITTKSNSPLKEIWFYFNDNSITEELYEGYIKNVMVIEGNHCMNDDDNYEFFDGIQSIGKINSITNKYDIPIISCGKNLIGVNNKTLENIKVNTGSHPNNLIINNIKVNKLTPYIASFKSRKSESIANTLLVRYEQPSITNNRNHSLLWNEYNTDSSVLKFKTNNITNYLSYTFGNCVFSGNSNQNNWIHLYDIQLEELIKDNTIATVFEPYKEDNIIISLNKPLMKLSNNIYDEITIDGKLIRRVGKVVLTGIETWTKEFENDKVIGFFCNTTGEKHPRILLSNLFKYQSSNTPINECITATGNGLIKIFIKKSRLESLDIVGLKEFLSVNNLIGYYELKEPIVTNILANKIKLFKNGHINIDSIIPCTSYHVINLNKTSQIVNCIEEVNNLNSLLNQFNEKNIIIETLNNNINHIINGGNK